MLLVRPFLLGFQALMHCLATASSQCNVVTISMYSLWLKLNSKCATLGLWRPQTVKDTKTRSIPRIPWLGPISSRFQLPRKWVVVFGSSFTFLATGAHSGLVLATTVGNRNGTSSLYTIMSLNPACWSENHSDADIPWVKVCGGEWCIFSESCRSSEFMCSLRVFCCVVICFIHTVMHV